MHWHASNSQNFGKYMQCFAVVNFTEFESNHTTLQTSVNRVVNHSIWPIKTPHFHSLCSDTCYNSAKPPENSKSVRKSPKNVFVSDLGFFTRLFINPIHSARLIR